MLSLNTLSWNTQGLNSPNKRSLVFQFIKSHNPHICVPQETHLIGSRTLSLKNPWGHHYHSTNLCGGSALPRVRDIRIFQRDILDHTPMFLNLDVSASQFDKLWRPYRFWISDEAVESQFYMELDTCWSVNPGLASVMAVWDAFKAFTHGQYRTIIARFDGSRRQNWLW